MTLKGLSRDPHYIHVYIYMYLYCLHSSNQKQPIHLTVLFCYTSNQLYIMIQNMLMKSCVQSNHPRIGSSAHSMPHFGSDVYSFGETIQCARSHTPYSYVSCDCIYGQQIGPLLKQSTMHVSAVSAYQRQA